MSALEPRSHAEEVALFRYGLISPVLNQQLERGQLASELRRLSTLLVRPPDSDRTRRFTVPTLERWRAAYRRGGLEALAPAPRSDRGRGRALSPELLTLLCDIRREHPDVTVPVMLRTLRADGRLDESVKAATVRRVLAEAGLTRAAAREALGRDHTRLRWQAEKPGALWHGDVCHGPTLTIGTTKQPVRVHALLDDASRYVVGLRVFADEREDSMLALLVSAVQQHGLPDALYLDNGATYRGEALKIACGRLGVSLLHARPYDPRARGKMERFWRRLREEALSHLGHGLSLADIEARLGTWLERHYHREPHAGLAGRSPLSVHEPHKRPLDTLEHDRLRKALTVQHRRRVRRDSTVDVDGETWEIPLGYLGGQIATIAVCLMGGPPVLEADGRSYTLSKVDPQANAHRKRRPAGETSPRKTGFDASRSLEANENEEEKS